MLQVVQNNKNYSQHSRSFWGRIQKTDEQFTGVNHMSLMLEDDVMLLVFTFWLHDSDINSNIGHVFSYYGL